MDTTKTDNLNPKYNELLERISRRYIDGQAQAIRSVNESLIDTNWSIGKYIVEYEQEGSARAKYGSKLLENLSHDLSLRYFAKEENYEGDNPPIGIILSKDKDELLVEYATYGMNSQLFVSKYQLYLPNKEELRKLISRQLEVDEI